MPPDSVRPYRYAKCAASCGRRMNRDIRNDESVPPKILSNGSGRQCPRFQDAYWLSHISCGLATGYSQGIRIDAPCPSIDGRGAPAGLLTRGRLSLWACSRTGNKRTRKGERWLTLEAAFAAQSN